MLTSSFDVQSAWKVLELNVYVARQIDFAVTLSFAVQFHNPVANDVIPDLLLIRALAVLEQAMRDGMIAGGSGEVVSTDEAQEVRELLALRDRIMLSATNVCSWETLHSSICRIRAILVRAGLVKDQSNFHAEGRRPKRTQTEAAENSGVASFAINVWDGDAIVYRTTWDHLVREDRTLRPQTSGDIAVCSVTKDTSEPKRNPGTNRQIE